MWGTIAKFVGKGILWIVRNPTSRGIIVEVIADRIKQDDGDSKNSPPTSTASSSNSNT